MRTVFAAAAALVLMVSPVLAEEAAPKLDSHLAAAVDLLEATNARANVMVVIQTLTPMMLAQVKKDHPNANDKALGIFQTEFQKAMEGDMEGFMQMEAVVYAEHLTEADLKALAAFYRSDVGKRYLAEFPAIMKEAAPLGGKWGMAAAMKALQATTEKLQKEGIKL